MVNEQQKYISGILKSIGFAMLTPVGSITFQWLVLQKGAFWNHFFHSMVVFLLGVVFLIWGHMILGEKNRNYGAR